MQNDEKSYLTELGNTDKEENTVPAEDRDWGEVSVGPDTVAQVGHGQHHPDHQAEQRGGVGHQQTCTHQDVGHHVDCGQGRCVWCQHGVSCSTELSTDCYILLSLWHDMLSQAERGQHHTVCCLLETDLRKLCYWICKRVWWGYNFCIVTNHHKNCTFIVINWILNPFSQKTKHVDEKHS